MSEVTWYEGKIKKVFKHDGETLEEVCKRTLAADSISEFYDSYEDQLIDTNWNKYVTHSGELFEVVERNWKDEQYDSLFNIVDNGDGTCNYDVRYYNGGCSFIEALEIALKRANN